ncbi:MAG: PIG-L family deacetylase [Solirubrobacterales bacterium]|nr:PIG-L family deacetylase [Solirubrobacterales bacterium]
MKAVVLSPHLDDAVLSCWHVLEGSGDVTVVDVFTGSPPPGTPAPWWDRLTGAQDPVDRMRERRAEDARALGLVGRDAVHLDLLDAQYRDGELATGPLAARVRELLEPDTVIHAPAGLGGHPDHELVRDAALELARGGWPVMLYADLPHGIAHGWPAWVAGVPERAGLDIGADWVAVLAEAGVTVERLVPRVRPLDVRARERKLSALAEYRTQRAALDGLAFVPLEDPRALAFEVSWAVPASAVGDPDERRSDGIVAEA